MPRALRRNHIVVMRELERLSRWRLRDVLPEEKAAASQVRVLLDGRERLSGEKRATSESCLVLYRLHNRYGEIRKVQLGTQLREPSMNQYDYKRTDATPTI